MEATIITSEQKINSIMKDLRLAPHFKGYAYIKEGLKIISEDATTLKDICKKLYPEISHRCDATASGVERCIRFCITDCVDKMPEEIRDRLFYSSLNKNGIITNKAFFAAIAVACNFI